MRLRIVTLVGAVAALLASRTGVAAAGPVPDAVPPACVVIDAPPLQIQAGYAPNGRSDCTALP